MGRFPMSQLELMEGMQRFRTVQIPDGSIASAIRNGSPYHQDEDSHGSKRMIYSGPELPEDIWCHIHSLMLLRDAARAACVSRAFFHSWRSHPHLMFDVRNIGYPGVRTGFTSRVDPILRNHSGKGLKTLKLDFTDTYTAEASRCIDSWLKFAIKAGIEELSLDIRSGIGKYNFPITAGIEKLYLGTLSGIGGYNFPCPALYDETGSSIGYLRLVNCAFHPTVRLGRLRSLTTLNLCDVRITGDELECLLSSCVVLQRLELRKCYEIRRLKLPFLLQQLSCLKVSKCDYLRKIKMEAPSISSFQFHGRKSKLLLGESLQLKNLDISFSRGMIYYARKKLPSSAPNLESLTISSHHEMLTTTMTPIKLNHLKYLRISLDCTYDYFSLVSFLAGAPSLETFILKVWIDSMEGQSIFVDTSPFRLMSGYRHSKLKRVEIGRFYSTKSLVELACHILENATSLECLTLDTSAGHCGRTRLLLMSMSMSMRVPRCPPMNSRTDIPKAISGITTYIEGIVPSTVKLNVVKPCNECYIS